VRRVKEKEERMDKLLWISAAAGLVAAMAMPAAGLAQQKLDVTVEGLQGESLADEAAFCIPDAAAHQTSGKNVQPGISWSAGPEGTQSYAIIMVDPDVPTEFDNFNKEGAMLAADMKRQNFYHWVLVDIPAATTSLPAGADTAEKSPKKVGQTEHGVRGVNDYTKFMTGDMAGDYGGYDGPCPPWNDERMHNYTFRVYALDVPSLGLSGAFTGPDAEKAMEGHVLAQGEAVGTYTLNPAMR
jgi:Raf kinase inhibitor-like YbhB/YbcL family protein